MPAPGIIVALITLNSPFRCCARLMKNPALFNSDCVAQVITTAPVALSRAGWKCESSTGNTRSTGLSSGSWFCCGGVLGSCRWLGFRFRRCLGFRFRFGGYVFGLFCGCWLWLWLGFRFGFWWLRTCGCDLLYMGDCRDHLTIAGSILADHTERECGWQGMR